MPVDLGLGPGQPYLHSTGLGPEAHPGCEQSQSLPGPCSTLRMPQVGPPLQLLLDAPLTMRPSDWHSHRNSQAPHIGSGASSPRSIIPPFQMRTPQPCHRVFDPSVSVQNSSHVAYLASHQMWQGVMGAPGGSHVSQHQEYSWLRGAGPAAASSTQREWCISESHRYGISFRHPPGRDPLLQYHDSTQTRHEARTGSNCPTNYSIA